MIDVSDSIPRVEETLNRWREASGKAHTSSGDVITSLWHSLAGEVTWDEQVMFYSSSRSISILSWKIMLLHLHS